MPASLLSAVLLALAAANQEDAPGTRGAQTDPPAAEEGFRAHPTWKELGKDLWFDPMGKRLLLRARVCLREGYLEHLLCSRNSKEHESILATEAPARLIHAGLLLTGAEVGHPVEFVPEFKPPVGTPLDIQVQWTDANGRAQRADARQWVREGETTRSLQQRWVFAGSSLYPHPDTGEMIYAADSGDLITVANFMSAILDVPFASTADDTARSYMAFTERIPPVGTPVMLILRPASIKSSSTEDPARRPASPAPAP